MQWSIDNNEGMKLQFKQFFYLTIPHNSSCTLIVCCCISVCWGVLGPLCCSVSLYYIQWVGGNARGHCKLYLLSAHVQICCLAWTWWFICSVYSLLPSINMLDFFFFFLVMSELLFECYSVPSVCYGVDSLFSLFYNQPKARMFLNWYLFDLVLFGKIRMGSALACL